MLNLSEFKVEFECTHVVCTKAVCYAYGADLKNGRIELQLNIDGDLFAHVHVTEAALDNHAGSVCSNTKLQKNKVTTNVCVCVYEMISYLREVCRCVMQEAELYQCTLGDF